MSEPRSRGGEEETQAERFVLARREAIARGEAVPHPETMGGSGYAPGSSCAILDFVDGSAAYLVAGTGFPGELRAAATVAEAWEKYGGINPFTRYRLVDTWNGGAGGRVVLFVSEARGAEGHNECFAWVLANKPYSFHEATTNQGLVCEPAPAV